MAPMRNWDIEIPDSAQIILWASSLPDISSEKMPTFTSWRTAFSASVRAKEVLPTAGLAPTTMSWPARRPASISSKVAKPVFTTVESKGALSRWWASSTAAPRNDEICW